MPGIDPGQVPDPMPVAAWNLMGGQIDWAGLPVIAEMIGVEDMQSLIEQLVAIRDHYRALSNAQ